MRRFASLILVLCIALVFLIAPMQAAQAPPESSAGPEGGDSSVLPEGWPEDAQSTTGPVPPEGIDRGQQGDLAPEVQVVLSGVPAYIWHNGCGPTAAGMVIGYWDGQGFPDLVPGSASTQTAAVNNMISSSGNYNDYCLPIDSYPNLLPDKSEAPFGDEHPNDCVADLMRTSQSYYSNYYGWSWYSDVDNALQGYVSMVAPHYTATVVNQPWGTFTWNSFRAEIDAGRPVVLLVDTDGDGGTDHFVTAYGYRDDGGTNQYACRDTWDTGIHWYNFAQMASGRPWGIYGATTFRLSGSVAPGPLVYNSRTIDDDNSGDSSGNGNGIVNCGETIELFVSLRNQGSATATGVNATISTSDPYVAFVYNLSSPYPDIVAGGTGTNVDDFDMWVSDSTPHNHVVHFNLNVTASNGGPWSTSFDVPVSCTGGEYKVHLPLVVRCWPPIPYQPTLYAISNPDGDGNYTVTWSAADGATTYQLHEDDNAAFSSPAEVYSGSGTSTSISGRAPGTYHYRVRGSNSFGFGGWSGTQSVTVQSTSGWTTIKAETFEGPFPNDWDVGDTNASGGDYYWGKRTCRTYAGSYSGWAVGGGDGASRACGSEYPTYVVGWMVYGPFSLADATAADLTFQLWLNTELGYDKVLRAASVDGNDFYGYSTSGTTEGWIAKTLDLAAVPTLGDLTGRSNVWIALVFISDSTITRAEGAYVDNIVLRKYVGSGLATVERESEALPATVREEVMQLRLVP